MQENHFFFVSLHPIFIFYKEIAKYETFLPLGFAPVNAYSHGVH